MGNFYKNVSVIGAPREALLAELTRLGRTTYVSPTRGAYTVVFDRESDDAGDPQELGDLSLTLSQSLDCDVLAAGVYDEDVLLLGLYSKGRQLGEYNSSGSSSLGATALARAASRVAWAPLIWLLLHLPHLAVIFESARHAALLKVLAMPPWAYATGYRYIAQGEPPPDLEDVLLEQTPLALDTEP